MMNSPLSPTEPRSRFVTDNSKDPPVTDEITATQSQEMVTVDLSIVHAYGKRAKIMMVDDEPIIIMAVETHLRGIGYQTIVETSDSTDAIAMLGREQPDLLLLDINMPQVDGLELLQQIRLDPRWQCLPVIILTACDDPATRRKALCAGCTDFLSKPIDPSELALRVRNTLVAKTYFNLLSRHAEQLEAQVLKQAEAVLASPHASEVR